MGQRGNRRVTDEGELALDLPSISGRQVFPWVVALSLLIAAIAAVVVLFGHIQLPAFQQFVPLHITFVFLLDALTAFLLFGQFHYRRLILYLLLGCAYLFNALLSIPFLLSFPGAIQTAGGIIGGSQSAIWTWHYWHILFPLFVATSLLLHGRSKGEGVPYANLWSLTLISILGVVVLVLVLTASITFGHDFLPVLIDVTKKPPLTRTFYWLGGFAAIATMVALGLCWWYGRRMVVLHLWLAVAMTAFLADVAASLGANARYTLGWYFGRVESLIAASILLILFLSELNWLYRRLAGKLRAEVSGREMAEDHARKLLQTVEQNPNLIFITNTDGIIEYVNPKFTEITGYSLEEAIGHNPRILKSGETPAEVYETLWHTIKSGKVWQHEIMDKRKDGSFFWANATISSIKDEDGVITHFISAHEDITARKESEAALKGAVLRAEIAMRAKTEMLANMSHELRTPLNAIIGFSETILGETFGSVGSEKNREYLQDIHVSAEHLLGVINDILEVSSLEAGALQLHEERICISALIDAAIRLLSHRAKEGKVTVTQNIPSQLPQLYADERRVKQIFVNLLSNAIKFTPEGGKVSVTARHEKDGGVSVSVSDTGIGMSDDDIAVAMTKFGQVDGSLSRTHEGTGLGLPLTKGLVEAHNGTLEIESRKGYGTKVTITFPMDRVV